MHTTWEAAVRLWCNSQKLLTCS